MKGIGCIAIVLHHLAVYGPMSDVVRGAFPAVINGLEIYARLAVQMFFVLAGFLAAAQLAPEGQPSSSSTASHLGLILKRYRRLVTPFVFAIASAIHRDRQALVCPCFAFSTSKPCPITGARPVVTRSHRR